MDFTLIGAVAGVTPRTKTGEAPLRRRDLAPGIRIQLQVQVHGCLPSTGVDGVLKTEVAEASAETAVDLIGAATGEVAAAGVILHTGINLRQGVIYPQTEAGGYIHMVEVDTQMVLECLMSPLAAWQTRVRPWHLRLASTTLSQTHPFLINKAKSYLYINLINCHIGI